MNRIPSCVDGRPCSPHNIVYGIEVAKCEQCGRVWAVGWHTAPNGSKYRGFSTRAGTQHMSRYAD